MSFKKCKVVMLPTNEKANKGDIIGNDKGFTIDDISYSLTELSFIQAKVYKLYFLSDEEIKGGDWYIHNQKGVGLRVQKCIGTNLPMDAKKIIATTDKSLKQEIFGLGETAMCSLPQPSQSFIEKFVEEYNKGNVITEVMVEYEDKIAMDGHTIIGSELKISKDNTITIRKMKDSWNRDEVKHLLECAWNGGAFWGSSKPNSHYFEKWIEENL